MIGPSYWATGITVESFTSRGWGVKAEFYDHGFCDDDIAAGHMSTQGVIRTRHLTLDLTVAATVLKADVERLSIGWRDDPALFADVPEDKTGWPADWRQQVEVAAAAIGFEPVGTTDLSKIPFGIDKDGHTVYLAPRR